MVVCCGMAVRRTECEEGKGTYCENGDSDIDW
jgi:hypothetical protein